MTRHCASAACALNDLICARLLPSQKMTCPNESAEMIVPSLPPPTISKYTHQYQPQSSGSRIEQRDETRSTHIKHPTAQTTLCRFLLFPPVPRALNLPTLIRPTTRPVARLNFRKEESECAVIR